MTPTVQVHQTEGYIGEVRDGVQRVGEFGLATMPLPGAKAAVTYQSGHRGYGTILGVEDPRYRPRGLKPGESGLYMVDGAKADGTGGTLRWLLRAALGWGVAHFGATINIGDSNTVNITMTASGTLKLAANVEITGDLKVDGSIPVVPTTVLPDLMESLMAFIWRRCLPQ
jgi:phage baseplate assembly protein V